MSERLGNPPLVEALCEFRFHPQSNWDWTIPGRLYERIGQEFTERNQVESIGFQLADRPVSYPPQPVKVPDRVQFRKPDASAMVQVGPRLLVINQFRPYPNWEHFREMILRVYKECLQISGAYQGMVVGLRYINRIMISTEIQELITVAPKLGGSLNRTVRELYQRYELEYDQPPGILIHQTGTQKSQQERVLMLDLDFRSAEMGKPQEEFSLESWIDSAHDRIYEAFVASLHESTYAGFREVSR